MSRQLDTGTGANRRRLTEEEARNGDVPTPFTREEWESLHQASSELNGPAVWTRFLMDLVRRQVML
jgi:hypothetical protein